MQRVKDNDFEKNYKIGIQDYCFKRKKMKDEDIVFVVVDEDEDNNMLVFGTRKGRSQRRNLKRDRRRIYVGVIVTDICSISSVLRYLENIGNKKNFRLPFIKQRI